MNEVIEKIQQELAPYERVRKFYLLPEPFNLESNTLTPSLKVRRKIVMEKYKDIIENMYRAR
jgi:long-chain acyl-CoA synthetase